MKQHEAVFLEKASIRLFDPDQVETESDEWITGTRRLEEGDQADSGHMSSYGPERWISPSESHVLNKNRGGWPPGENEDAIKGELDAGQIKTTGGTTEIHFIYEENKAQNV